MSALANDIVGSGYSTGGYNDFRLRQRNSSTVRLPGYAGANTDTAAVVTFIQGRNTPTASGSATVAVPPGGGFTGGISCTPPTLPSSISLDAIAEQVAVPAVDTQTPDQAASDVIDISTEPGEFATNSVDEMQNETPVDSAIQSQAPSGTISLTIGMLPVGKTITITFDALIANPVTPGAVQISNQGTVSGSNFTSVLTDDPDTGDASDPTDTPLHVLDTKRCGIALDTPYTFNSTPQLEITVTQLGDVACLQVVRTDENHPNATTPLETGRYWVITATNSGATAATGYEATLVLPHNVLSSPTVCKYPGGQGGAGWDCASDSFDTSTVTRSGITEFSDWTVGNEAGATAVTLSGMEAESVATTAPWFAALLVLGIGAGIVLLRRRPSRS